MLIYTFNIINSHLFHTIIYPKTLSSGTPRSSERPLRERGLQKERPLEVVPGTHCRIPEHWYNQLFFVVERRHGPLRPASYLHTRPDTLRDAGAEREATQLQPGLRGGRERRHPDQPGENGFIIVHGRLGTVLHGFCSDRLKDNG